MKKNARIILAGILLMISLMCTFAAAHRRQLHYRMTQNEHSG